MTRLSNIKENKVGMEESFSDEALMVTQRVAANHRMPYKLSPMQLATFHSTGMVVVIIYAFLLCYEFYWSFLFFGDLLENWRPNPSIFNKILGFLGTITILHITGMICFIFAVFRIYYLVPRKTNVCVCAKKTLLVVCGITLSILFVFFGQKYEELSSVPDTTSPPDTFAWVVKACMDNVWLNLADLCF